MTQHLPCDALIVHRAPGLLPKPGGQMLQLGDDYEKWPEAAEAWLRLVIKYAQQPLGFAIGGPETPHERAMVGLVHDHYRRAEVQSKTISRFAVEWGRNFCRTLMREPRWATSLGEPWKGRPAFVVSAGPSLDRNGALLPEAQKRGPVIALNSSVTACMQRGVVPDLVMCSEAVDLSARMAPLRELNLRWALDAVACPENWAVTDDGWAYGWAEPNLVKYMLALDALPLNYTGSVACAAVSLALLWGADPVVLIGQDCAYTDGRMYASGTPYEDIRCTTLEGAVHFTGKSKQMDPLYAIDRIAWGGEGRVTTSHDMEVFVDWFETTAERHTIVNATEGGCRMQYTYEQPLSKVLDVFPVRDPEPLPTPERASTRAVREEICERAEHTLAHVTDYMTPPSNFELLNMWAVPAVFESMGMNPLDKAKCMQAAMAQGCREILEVLNG